MVTFKTSLIHGVLICVGNVGHADSHANESLGNETILCFMQSVTLLDPFSLVSLCFLWAYVSVLRVLQCTSEVSNGLWCHNIEQA